MKSGDKNSQELLYTNIAIFNEIPTELTSWEIGKLLKLVRKNKKLYSSIDKLKNLIDDLFLGLIVDQTVGCWYIRDKWDYYRKLTFKSKKGVAVHRLAYELFIGDIILQEICHHCDRPGCSNPWHLFNDSHANNMEDARLKDRWHKTKTLTPAEKFLLWKHINNINSHFEVTREAIVDTSRIEHEVFKINDSKR